MTVPWISITTVSRSNCANAVALAAYRHATRMELADGASTKDHRGQAAKLEHSEIILPGAAPAWAVQAYGPPAFGEAMAPALDAGQDLHAAERTAWARLSERLWNDIERVETLINKQWRRARLAWTVEAAMPRALSANGRIRLLREWARDAFGDHHTAVDCVLRDAGRGKPAAFLMLPTRPFEHAGWGAKDRLRGRWSWIVEQRQLWELHVREALERERAGAQRRAP